MEISCKVCFKKCVKNGLQSNGKQRYKCGSCGRRQQIEYLYNACKPNIDNQIIAFCKEGVGIRSTARLLNISSTTLLKRIIAIAGSIPPPCLYRHKTYEVDEMCTFVKNKKNLIWIAYALERETKRIVSFNVGKRTNKTLNWILKSLVLSDADKIYTDGLKNYKFLIPKELHIVKRFGTNMIERYNLSLRTHLKRLNRRTICFSRSIVVLKAVLKIYFWSY
ncbi:IS1 family transposase [Flavobacterium sp.]|uniref:IS1 family transposase n=1 Tax=Flavobacterium sp. TaxID=239 RepID=UPI0039E5334D